VLTLGVAAFHWRDEVTHYARAGIALIDVRESDVRARAPSGEARLLVDQSLEQFSSRLNARDRAKAAPSNRPAASADKPSSQRAESEEG
jgi:hypothetical protein